MQRSKKRALELKKDMRPYTAGFVTALIVLVVTSVLALSDKLFGWEIRVFLEVNTWPENWQYFFKFWSQFGLWICIVLVVGAFLLKKWQFTWRLASSLLVGYALVIVLKHGIGRGRPDEYIASTHVYWAEYGSGFPSAHVTLTTIAMLSLLPVLPRKWWWIVPVCIVLVGISRLYLGAHAPLDVIGGVALGTIIVTGVYLLPKPLQKALRLYR